MLNYIFKWISSQTDFNRKEVQSLTPLEILQHQSNQLFDLWQSTSGQEKFKLLVKIMDLEEDIDAQIQTLKAK